MTNYIEEAIKKAGYKDHGSDELYATTWGRNDHEYQFEMELFLDPLFWQSLGKALGWSGIQPYQNGDGQWRDIPWWQYKWHRFIDHLAEEKPVEEFFKALLQ